MAKTKVTIKDIAKQAGVSLSAVSLYLNDRPGLGDVTRERIRQAVEELGYIPRQMRGTGQQANFIGLMVEHLPISVFSDMFYGAIIEGIDARAREQGYNIILSVLESHEAALLQINQQRDQLAGIIALGGGEINRHLIKDILATEIPVTLVDNFMPELEVNCILPDYLYGGYKATSYLLEQGYRRIAFIQGPEKYFSLQERYHGYCCALIDAGLPIPLELVQPANSHGIPNKGYPETIALLESGANFDALLCVSDRTAFGALEALREYGIKVPGDVAVMGFDNVAQSAHTNPKLTTVNVFKRDLGVLAVENLLQVIENNEAPKPIKLLTPTHLVIRGST